MSTVINSGSSLTDKAKAFPTISNKLSSGIPKTSRRSGKNRIIKFHGTEVSNVIIHYTKRSKVNPENVVIKEFDSSKLKGQFETVNIQVIADYITITFYKQEHSNLTLQREMIPANRVEHICFISSSC